MTKGHDNMRILDAPLMFVWYDMIDCGEKPEEYRAITPYWFTRLCVYRECGLFYRKVTKKDAELFDANPDGFSSSVKREINSVYSNLLPRDFTHIRFRRGYTKTTMLFEIKSISIGKGNPKWGAPEGKEVFIIKLGERICADA